jgi:NADPH-dependent 2,4-dienoyl-CoA reductase/sulfur reductase-like enzyme
MWAGRDAATLPVMTSAIGSDQRPRVVVAGGGVAALEACLFCARRGPSPSRAWPRPLLSRLLDDAAAGLRGAAGPRLAGVPCDPGGFIPVDAGLHVDDDPDVFAIGDGTAGAHKHGGLAAQQADAVAREIARRAGAVVADEPYRPALRAVVRTGRGPRYLRTAPPGGAGDCAVSGECLWWPPSKVVAQWLVPWLAAFDPTDRPVAPSA